MFVTGNAGKLAELQALVAPLGIEVMGDARGYPEVQAATLSEVGEAGAAHLLATGLAPPFLLEDSGLFVAALNGFPGVYSRYALETLGLEGILRLMGPHQDRSAWFATDLVLVEAGPDGPRVRHFAGRVDGDLAHRPAGTGGFGFDPIFVPRGHDRTFAEMDRASKSALSHRGQAVRALVAYLKQTAKP